MPSERRLHPLSILFSLGSLIRSFALPLLVVVATAGSRGWGWELWLLGLVPFYAIAGVGRYLTFRYRYEPHEMVVRTGLLFRNERHIPYTRIQNLDGVQNVFHRLFNVVTVRVETGGGQKPEATMSVLPVADLEEMRRRVFAGKAAGKAAGQAAGTEDAVPEEAAAEPAAGRTLLHLPPRELLLFGLIENRGAVLIAAALGLFFELQVSDRFFGESFNRGAVRDAVREVMGWASIGDWLASSRVVVVVISILAFLVLLRLVSMAWALVRLHGFRLTLADEDLRTEFGLLTRVSATIPLRRIQTLSIREGPFFRLFGRVSVKADTAGADGGEEEDKPKHREWLAPILRRAGLPSLVQEILPGLDLAAVDWQPVHPRAFRRELKQSLLVLGLAAVPLGIFLRWWALAPLAVLLVWFVIVARKSVAHLGWAVTGDAVLFRSGWIWRRVIVARFVKIQAVAIHESPFDRRAAMARVRVDTAGAKDLTHRVDIPYLARETARELHDLLAARAARTAFRW